jgi:hypothetical protein
MKMPNTMTSTPDGTRAETSWRVQPVGQQRGLTSPVQAPADVRRDPRQPRGELVRVPEPVQRDERAQERLLHDVVGVARVGAELFGSCPDHGLVSLDEQPEGHRVAVAGQVDEVSVVKLRHWLVVVPGS